MGNRMALLAAMSCCILARPVLAQVIQPDFADCIVSAGLFAQSGPEPWSTEVALTVSESLDASRIHLDRAGVDHWGFMVWMVLPHLRFQKGCAGIRLTVRISWKPDPEGHSTVSVKENQMVLTNYPNPPRSSRRHGGPMELSDEEEVQRLRETPSIREFLRKRGASPDL